MKINVTDVYVGVHGDDATVYAHKGYTNVYFHAKPDRATGQNRAADLLAEVGTRASLMPHKDGRDGLVVRIKH